MNDTLLWQDRMAKMISHVLSPIGIAAGLFGGQAIFHREDDVWGPITIALILFVVIPIIVILWIRRHGIKEVYNPEPLRRQRFLFMGTICYLTGYIIFIKIGAEPYLVWSACTFAVAAGLVCGINLFWKISIHSVAVSGGVFIAMVMTDSGVWPLLLAPGLVGWARFWLGAHTTFQILAGSLLGAIVPAILLPHFI